MVNSRRRRSVDRLFGNLIAAEGNDIRAPLRDSIAQVGTEAAPTLVAWLSDPDDLTRWEAINLLGVIAPPDAAESVLEFALGEEEKHARWRAFWAVTRFDTGVTVPLLRRALRSRKKGRSWRAAMILSMMGMGDAGPFLLDGLNHPDPWNQWEALCGIKALGLKGAEQTVGRYLDRDYASHLRYEATLALGCIGSPQSTQLLKAALRDQDPGVRWRAAMSLGRLGPSALPTLRRRRRKERDPEVLRQIESEIRQQEVWGG